MGRAEDLFDRLSKDGEAAIDQLIEDRQAEELFLDFKQSADQGRGRRLHDADRNNLAKAISGFGNSEGGVIVWGIDCRDRQDIGDVAQAKIPIDNPKRFLSRLEGVVSGCTTPPHPGVRHLAIETAGTVSGFVATHVSKSELAPHQCLRPLQYYMRAGSSFEPVPHSVLAGLFGRRPQPSLFHNWFCEPLQVLTNQEKGDARVVYFAPVLAIHNKGLGVARDVYVNVQLWGPVGGTTIRTRVLNSDWTGERVVGVIINVICPESFRLPPGAHTSPVSFEFELAPPFSTALTYKISFGSSECAATHLEKKTEAAELAQIYADALEPSLRPELTLQKLGKRFADAILPK